MNIGKYVFAQVLSLVSRYEFQKCVDRYNGDHRTRGLNCWSQFAHMFYGQLTGRNGLRDICLCLGALESRLYHSGIKRSVDHSTLARANESRDWRIRGLRIIPHRYRQTSVHRQPRVAVRYRQGCVRAGLHHHFGQLYTHGLGARQILEGRGKDAYPFGPARQHPDAYTSATESTTT